MTKNGISMNKRYNFLMITYDGSDCELTVKNNSEPRYACWRGKGFFIFARELAPLRVFFEDFT